MGRTSKPLRILVTTEALLQSQEIMALVEKGHTVVLVPLEADLILGPTACAMDESLLPYVSLAVKRARERVVGGPAKDVTAEGVTKGRKAKPKGEDGREATEEVTDVE